MTCEIHLKKLLTVRALKWKIKLFATIIPHMVGNSAWSIVCFIFSFFYSWNLVCKLIIVIGTGPNLIILKKVLYHNSTTLRFTFN